MRKKLGSLMVGSLDCGYPVTAETERLRIRPVSMNDLEAWTAFMRDEKAIEFFPMFDAKDAEANAEAWIKKQQERYADGRYGLQAIEEKASGIFIGQAGLLTQEVNGKEELEVGYSFLRAFWGKGYATEAAQFFKHFAIEQKLNPTIVSLIHKDNLPSKQVAIRNGMTSNESGEWKELPIEIFRISNPSFDL